jgi:hypothetical protein
VFFFAANFFVITQACLSYAFRGEKLHLIEEMLKVKSESIWIALENVLKKDVEEIGFEQCNIYDFARILSDNQAKAIKDAIAEACEIIDEKSAVFQSNLQPVENYLSLALVFEIS